MNEILGQDEALAILSAALASGRMHHAWLLHGPPGVGKFTVACRIAQHLLCHENSPTNDRPCGTCPACRYFSDGRLDHPDLHVIRKELAAFSALPTLRNRKQTNIPVDLLRERMLGGWCGSGDNRRYFEPPIGRSPLMHHGKVFIIDEAELLDASGQNAMLKTLEEPADETYLFLVTSRLDRLLPTIRSRCQQVTFRRLDDEVVQELLDRLRKAVLDSLDRQIDQLRSSGRGGVKSKQALADLVEHRQELADLASPRRQAILHFADGSAGRAALAMQYRLYRWVETLQPLLAHLDRPATADQLGPVLVQQVEQFAAAWTEQDPSASKEAANRLAVQCLLGLLGTFCRRRLAEQATGHADPSETERHMQPWLTGIDLLHRAEEQLAVNLSPALLLNNLAIQWTTRAKAR